MSLNNATVDKKCEWLRQRREKQRRKDIAFRAKRIAELQPRVTAGTATPEEKKELSRHWAHKARNDWYGYQVARYQRLIVKRLNEKLYCLEVVALDRDRKAIRELNETLAFEAYMIASKGKALFRW